jgi:phosphoacetylglucosamine mutase
MVTASHNPSQDNGVKIVDHNGAVLSPYWEEKAEVLVNSNNLYEDALDVILDRGLTLNTENSVLIGFDTRESSPRLVEALTKGVNVVGLHVRNFGLLTTGQLHWMVWHTNQHGLKGEALDQIDVQAYYDYYTESFGTFTEQHEIIGNYETSIVIDASDGIGGP